ncbi:MAG TPA: DegT/DnrJ/EryC1/StrS family aminotransferase [Candidatus Limnocylindrales bacterium]|nr:DegT/DnrJ/EryC1/StrS family aminotransferase [Candidatus Limnocylindrales bacterium]
MIHVFQPALGKEELKAVKEVFESNWVGKGKITNQFEEKFASHLGVKRELVRSLSCCTEGLFLSMELLGIGPGDEVILPSISFVGAANAVASAGIQPTFCDVNKRTLNTTADFIEEKITPRTKAVIILHYGGVPCQMDEICELVRDKGIALIEDSACSVASRYKGRACGTFGDIGVWSFDAMKILVTGDGAMLYCRTPEVAQRAEKLLYLGLTTQSGLSSSVDTKWWEFEISCYGRRAIMNDIASAIGVEQLRKLPDFINRRREIHEYYNQALSKLDWLQLPPQIPAYVESSYYFYWIQTQPKIRDRLAKYLREKGIYTTFRYYPLHWVKFYGVTTHLPHAEEAARSTLCLPIHQSLSDEEVNKIIESIYDFGKDLSNP